MVIVITNMHYMLTDCSSLFFKGYLAIANQLEQKNIPGVQKLPERYQSGITGFHSKIPRSSQYFQVVNQIASGLLYTIILIFKMQHNLNFALKFSLYFKLIHVFVTVKDQNGHAFSISETAYHAP